MRPSDRGFIENVRTLARQVHDSPERIAEFCASWTEENGPFTAESIGTGENADRCSSIIRYSWPAQGLSNTVSTSRWHSHEVKTHTSWAPGIVSELVERWVAGGGNTMGAFHVTRNADVVSHAQCTDEEMLRVSAAVGIGVDELRAACKSARRRVELSFWVKCAKNNPIPGSRDSRHCWHEGGGPRSQYPRRFAEGAEAVLRIRDEFMSIREQCPRCCGPTVRSLLAEMCLDTNGNPGPAGVRPRDGQA